MQRSTSPGGALGAAEARAVLRKLDLWTMPASMTSVFSHASHLEDGLARLPAMFALS